jgi:hypothetical protein
MIYDLNRIATEGSAQDLVLHTTKSSECHLDRKRRLERLERLRSLEICESREVSSIVISAE